MPTVSLSLTGSEPRGLSEWATASIEGFGGEAAEGSHVAISYFETEEDSLDVFFRLLLGSLILFRAFVAHPGFDWATPLAHGQAHLRCLTSLTTVSDPEERRRRLRQYRLEARREFDALKGSSGVIYLPDGSDPGDESV